jgi:phosphopentomutase
MVIDALGVGALPDALEFSDAPSANTLGNVSRAVGGLALPRLGKLGLGNIISIEGVLPDSSPCASYGQMHEVSKGKDTTTGHWELAGLILDEPFETFPEGFPQEIIDEFVNRTGCGGVLGNVPASGTEIVERFHQLHEQTGHPILYTSADSVFQIACHVDVVPLDRLYSWCETARALLNEKSSVSRVIARPYRHGKNGVLERLGGDRRDYAVPPLGKTILDAVVEAGGKTVAVGKIEDIFCGVGVTHSIHTKGNTHGLEIARQILAGEFNLGEIAVSGQGSSQSDKEFVFINLVDTDSLYGHRRDPRGYAQALEEIDIMIGRMLPLLGEDDLFIVTGDHGCDPTAPGTDHTREAVPVLVYNVATLPSALGTKPSFTWVAEAIAEWLKIPWNTK